MYEFRYLKNPILQRTIKKQFYTNFIHSFHFYTFSGNLKENMKNCTLTEGLNPCNRRLIFVRSSHERLLCTRMRNYCIIVFRSYFPRGSGASRCFISTSRVREKCKSVNPAAHISGPFWRSLHLLRRARLSAPDSRCYVIESAGRTPNVVASDKLFLVQ